MSLPIVALIYDFDKTLSPKDMQEYSFLPGINVEPDRFWGLCRDFALDHEMDGVLTYMYLMKKMANGEADLSRDRLRALGRDVAFFPGVETWFDRINQIGRENGVEVEHYIISSGLTDIIKGSAIGDRFKAVFAASFCYDEHGVACWPAMAVNYTSKTQFLFRVNKGVLDVTEHRALNEFMPEEKRRVPFSNMIYIGDGLTDVPSMKLTKLNGGHSIAVWQEDEQISNEMLLEGRVDFAVKADYSRGSDMEKMVFAIIDQIAASAKTAQMHVAACDRAKNAV